MDSRDLGAMRLVLRVTNFHGDKEKNKHKMMKAVSIKHVDSVHVDAERGLVTVIGAMDVTEITDNLRKKKWQFKVVAVGPPEDEYLYATPMMKYQPEHYHYGGGHYHGYNYNLNYHLQPPQYGNSYYSTQQLQPPQFVDYGHQYPTEENPNACVIS